MKFTINIDRLMSYVTTLSTLEADSRGGDVACLMPGKITSQVAMVMMFELLSLVSLSIRDVESVT